MSKRTNILVAIALLATIGVVGCGGSDKPTAPVGDTVAPAAVTNLDGWVNGGSNPSVVVSWKAGAELDLAGYNVYRSEDGATAALVGMTQSSAWTDGAVSAGKSYSYEVSAIDTSENESARVSSDTFVIESDVRPMNNEID